MITWETEELPKPGQRIAIELSDGRVCSGKVTDTLGFELEYVDSIDILANMGGELKWTLLENPKEPK